MPPPPSARLPRPRPQIAAGVKTENDDKPAEETEVDLETVVDVDVNEQVIDVPVQPTLQIPVGAAIEVTLETAEMAGSEITVSVGNIAASNEPTADEGNVQTAESDQVLGAVGGGEPPVTTAVAEQGASASNDQIVSVMYTSSDDPEVAVKLEYHTSASHHRYKMKNMCKSGNRYDGCTKRMKYHVCEEYI